MAVDSYGLPLHFTVMGAEVHDCKEASNLIAALPKVAYVIADRGYDSQGATRYDKLKRNFEGTLALICAFLWLPM